MKLNSVMLELGRPEVKLRRKLVGGQIDLLADHELWSLDEIETIIWAIMEESTYYYDKHPIWAEEDQP